MSQDEVTSIHKSRAEHDRKTEYFTIVAQQGTKELKTPKDLYLLPWEKQLDEQKGNTLTKQEFIQQANNTLNNGKK